MRVVPDMQTGPFGYVLTWALIIVIGVGLLFASGLGGAVVWALFWVLVAIAVYFGWKKFIGRLV